MKCNICGNDADFICSNNHSLRESVCPTCGSSRRQSDLARVILDTFLPATNESLNIGVGKLHHIRIFEAQATGPIHEALRGLPNYFCSEYFDDTPAGQKNVDGILCQDLQNLTFPSDYFDLVITQDVFEHIREPWKAFGEVSRILKSGGFHIFTVPYHEGRPTTRRIVTDGENDINTYPPVYHDDSLREKGAVVYMDFGADLSSILNTYGFTTDNIPCGIWYSDSELPKITNGNEYQDYIKNYNDKKLLEFFKYNSWVFRSKKNRDNRAGLGMLEWTGERFLPFIDPSTSGAEIHYEHLHRYAFAAQFVKNKKVLDLACGEGFGSFILSKDAEYVVGIDIDKEVIIHASMAYQKENLNFIQGSILNVPIDRNKFFDVIVCFEAIEHIEEHDALLLEITRLLREDGILIISTPNKKLYSDDAGYKNPYHKKELYYSEFIDLLNKNFNFIYLSGQRIISGSSIFPAIHDEKKSLHSEFVIELENDHFSFTTEIEKEPRYFIAIASNQRLDSQGIPTSYLIDRSDKLISLKNDMILDNQEKIQTLNTILASKDREIYENAIRIQTLNDAFILRDRQIQTLNDTVASKDQHIMTLEREKSALQIQVTRIYTIEKEISLIKSSIVWQLTMKFHTKFIERLFPQNTKRRAQYDLGLKGCRILFNDGWDSFWRHFREKVLHKPVSPEKILIPQISPPKSVNMETVKKIDTCVSVIIPTKNAGPDFEYVVQRIAGQKGIGEIEIVVVDSGSTDNTLSFARKFGAQIITIPPEQFNHGTTRDLGTRHAKGTYLCFIVQDAIPIGEYWLYRMVNLLHEHQDISAVSCRQVPRSDADLFASFMIWQYYTHTLQLDCDRISEGRGAFENLTYIEKRRFATLDNVSCLIRKEIYEKFRFMKTPSSEDLDLGKRLIVSGHKIAHLVSAGVIHSHNRNSRYMLKRSYVDNKTVAEILEFHTYEIPREITLPEILGSLVTLYNSINAILDANDTIFFTSPRDLGNKITAGIVSAFKVNEERPPVIPSTECLLAEDLATLNKMMPGYPVNSNRKMNDIALNRYVHSLERFHEFLSVFNSLDNKKDQFVESYFKIFANVAGACIAEYYLQHAGRDEYNREMILIDEELSRGV